MKKAIDLGALAQFPSIEELELTEMLASQLHREYRAAEKAMHRNSRDEEPRQNLHDHGWESCHRKRYFQKRAELLMRRASCKRPQTLGEAEEALHAEVLRRRLFFARKGGAR